MKIYRAILESLKDLDIDGAAKLFDNLVSTGRFEEKFKPDNTVMFIFPDGKLLGTSQEFEIPKTSTGKLGRNMLGVRQASHSEITDFLPKELKKSTDDKWKRHPFQNDRVGKYYNLIIVAAGHLAKSVIIPFLVDPTPDQSAQLALFEKAGFDIQKARESWSGPNPSVLESLAKWEPYKTDELFERMLANGNIEEKTEVDDSIMFVFPNGRMLGAKYYEEMGGAREFVHLDLYQFLEKEETRISRDWDVHPVLNDALGDIYNIVIVAPDDEMNDGDSGGYILLNEHVELTPKQRQRIIQLVEYGYQVAGSPAKWVKQAWDE